MKKRFLFHKIRGKFILKTYQLLTVAQFKVYGYDGLHFSRSKYHNYEVIVISVGINQALLVKQTFLSRIFLLAKISA